MDTFIFHGTWLLVTETARTLPDASTVELLRAAHLLTHEFTDTAHNFCCAVYGEPAAAGPTKIEERKLNNSSARDTAGKKADGAPGCMFIPLRAYFWEQGYEEGARAARAKGLLAWRINTRYCSACGMPLTDGADCTLRTCSSCHTDFFPRIEPCIIVLVNRNDEVLLVRHKFRNQNLFACIAGFVEIGESIEQAVSREVREETGIEITGIRYCASQGWPFPDQLMLAFRAEYKSGTIQIQEEELCEARWFPRHQLPNIPQPGSIAYRLISGEFD
ncbi:MAG: NAD(+) diphosphatase [Treponema sp.]|nr:NAD(+) diphosphatase [Treponema sp.]